MQTPWRWVAEGGPGPWASEQEGGRCSPPRRPPGSVEASGGEPAARGGWGPGRGWRSLPQPAAGRPGSERGRKPWRGALEPPAKATPLPPDPSPSPEARRTVPGRARGGGGIRFRSSLINFLFNVTGPHCGRGKHVTRAINLRLWRLRPPPRSRDPADSDEQVGHRLPGLELEPPPSGRCCARFSPRGSWAPGSARPAAQFPKGFCCWLGCRTWIFFPHPPGGGFLRGKFLLLKNTNANQTKINSDGKKKPSLRARCKYSPEQKAAGQALGWL